MTEQELERLQALAEAATPGPWEWRGDNMHAVALTRWTRELAERELGSWQKGEPGPRLIETDAGVYGPCPSDRAFIAAARAAVPALVAEVRRLRGVVRDAYAEGWHHQFTERAGAYHDTAIGKKAVTESELDAWDDSNAKRALDGGGA